MDAKTIQKLIASDGARVAKIAEQKKYAGGYNVAILGRRAHEEPDNRIPTPICKTGINMVVGYMAVDGKISYSTGDDPYWDEKLKPIFEANDEQLLTKECLKTALRHGRAWVYHYTKDNEVRFVQVPIEQCIPIWSDDLPPRLIGMVRYYCHIEEDGKEKTEAYYYDDTSITKYEGPKGGDLAIAVRGEDGQPNPMPHGYLEVPFSERKMSEEGTNLFDSVIHLVDFFDRIISEGMANEEQRSASSYLLLADQLSGELDEMGLSEIDKLKITRTFENLGREKPVTDSVAFLTKNIPTDFLKLITETFERLIYEQMQVLNPNAMVDTGEISGRAYKFRILMFEYLCADIQTYISRGIQWGIRLIQNIDKSLSAKPQERPQVDIKWERNLPDDTTEAVDQFMKVSPGTLPIRTALKLLPSSLIPDLEEVAKEMEGEIERKREELNMDSKIDEERKDEDQR